MDGGVAQPKKAKKVFVILVIVFVALVGLSIWLIIFLVNKFDEDNVQTNTDEVVVADKMDGWDEKISDATKASIFSNDISEKLSNDLDYELDNAISDYEAVYQSTDGDMKFFIAIKYANFIYDRLGNIEAAVEIMNGVQNLVKLDYNHKVYYNSTLYDLYNKAGDGAKVEYYQNILENLENDEDEIYVGE